MNYYYTKKEINEAYKDYENYMFNSYPELIEKYTIDVLKDTDDNGNVISFTVGLDDLDGFDWNFEDRKIAERKRQAKAQAKYRKKQGHSVTIHVNKTVKKLLQKLRIELGKNNSQLINDAIINYFIRKAR